MILFVGFCRNNGIVHIDAKPSWWYFFPEDVIHYGLEGHWQVHKSKKHDGRFKQSFAGLERSFPLISFFNVYIVVALSYVKLWEEVFSS